MLILRTLAPLVLFILFTSCDMRGGGTAVEAIRTTAPGPGEGYLQVTRVVDGDTFWVDNGTEKGLKVRLLGIDAPESRKSFNKDVQHFGKESAAYLTRLIAGKKVKLMADVSPRDRYGRTLSYAYLEDGTFVNALLIRNGYAQVLTIAPNVRFAAEFVRLQRRAREKGLGLWARDFAAAEKG
ncbi:thermonuclease family protein [Daejeonella sp. JGW-45]|uniref:thermonuclease family protein n=1 Tax=Daejeonella sp. JGW-45 TaxID=3034148 RepID=UPI0023EC62FC|nr:thermonuclease family protein [Daejeonella sp. JGW-45]